MLLPVYSRWSVFKMGMWVVKSYFTNTVSGVYRILTPLSYYRLCLPTVCFVIQYNGFHGQGNPDGIVIPRIYVLPSRPGYCRSDDQDPIQEAQSSALSSPRFPCGVCGSADISGYVQILSEMSDVKGSRMSKSGHRR